MLLEYCGIARGVKEMVFSSPKVRIRLRGFGGYSNANRGMIRPGGGVDVGG